MEIDIEKLRKDLIDYYGTAMFNASSLAIIELTKVENASPQELINIALKNNFDLTEYETNNKKLF
ncbi:MAG: hypothetical protein E7171_04060 [Firmicutes bacterium]|nr:hypothetical protein [Bacillota bacterium]